MKPSPLLSLIALCTVALAVTAPAAQELGAQVRTKQEFGYGKLVATLKLSTEKGIINGLFMLKYQTGYPNGWTEIDYEYVPGNNDAWRPTAEGNCGPGGTPCTVSKLDSQNAADYISVNIIAGPLNAGPPGDSQVFYKLTKPYLEATQTYTFEFTSDKVRWSTAGLNNDSPFMFQKAGNNTSDIHDSKGMQFLVNRSMFIYLNIYSGLGYDGSFGGTGVVPKTNTEMIVEKVAFYPLIKGSFSTEPSMSSDFVHEKYTLDGAESTFHKIWLNEDSTNFPVYTKAVNSSVVPGRGLVMKYTYIP